MLWLYLTFEKVHQFYIKYFYFHINFEITDILPFNNQVTIYDFQSV